jgi:ABC-type branched-subunit amino acid transport system ATPase component
MRLLHYVEIENFKRFGPKQRIELAHPSVLIGPNNCGKTSAIQAIALWSQAVKTWFDARKDSSAKERTATSMNRLNIIAVPVRRARFFWHNTNVRVKNDPISLVITMGVEYHGKVIPLPMSFRADGNELVYCTPDAAVITDLNFMEHAAKIKVELLYPMSGMETEEPVLQPGRIDVLLGQGQTAQVLRNLCLMVMRSSEPDWGRVKELMQRLFDIQLSDPLETSRGSIELQYRQPNVKEELDVSSSGRGFQQMLLIFAYLFSHKRSVLLIDEPDAHLEILRQKQVYVLLRDIAHENESQVVMATHSEVILEEALGNNLTLLLHGTAYDLAEKNTILSSLSLFGAEHYIKARERGYVLYVEGGTDVDMLRSLAQRLEHPVAKIWDERINTYYVRNNHSSQATSAELERVEGGYGVNANLHFKEMKRLLPDLKGLVIQDRDGNPNLQDVDHGELKVRYWIRYELENYFITPQVLRQYAKQAYPNADLFSGFESDIDDVLDSLILEQIFDGSNEDFQAWKRGMSDPVVDRVIWEGKTQSRKLSAFAEEFFRRLADRVVGPMLLRKNELHHLIAYVQPGHITQEVSDTLDLLMNLFRNAEKPEADGL